MKKRRILLIAMGIILLLGFTLWAIFLRPARPVVSVAERITVGEADTHTLIVVYSYDLKVIPGAGHGFHGDAAQQAIDSMSEYFSRHLNEATLSSTLEG